MIQASIAVLALAALVLMSLRANRRLRHESRLPMQWSATGSVSWTAPRPLALACTPMLAGVVLIAVAAATIATTPRAGQEGLAIAIVAILSLAFLAAHSLHLWLIEKATKADGG